MVLGELHVIVTCSDRKTRPVELGRSVRSLRGKRLDVRIAEWKRALQGMRRGDPVRAAELYSGDQWSVAKSIPGFGDTETGQVRLWICSAGYGLLSTETVVQPYNATFTTGHLDSVVSSDAFDSGEWWRRLAKWTPRGHNGPRSLQALAEQLAATRNSFMLVAVSEPYLRAIASDLRDAMDVRGMRKRIGIISVGGKSLLRDSIHQDYASLAEAFIPADARLKRKVGGAMQSVNVRLARYAVASRSEWYPERAELVRRFAVLSSATPEMHVPRRERLTDDEISVQIGRIRRQCADATASSALRTLRDRGLACEQHRFSTLFREHEALQSRRARTGRIGGKRG